MNILPGDILGGHSTKQGVPMSDKVLELATELTKQAIVGLTMINNPEIVANFLEVQAKKLQDLKDRK
jgi:hypothetical protein